jgi:serine/threonine protein kinase
MERYHVIKSIGSGATSEVFLVEDKRSRRPYILKQMPTCGMSDQERARAKQEINVLQKIDHPNVVRYRESFITHDSICIVMERCATSLDAIIDKKRDEVEEGVGQPFPTSLLLEWMAELISAVHYLHTHQIIHRDIKPSNIFITDTNHLKLGDFGVCKVIRHQTEARKSLAQHPNAATGGTLSSYVIASHGAMLGTPLYLSPEIFEEDIPEYSAGSDVWALGAVFYEMCALRPPFEADNFFALITRIGSGVPPAPFSNGVDQRFERIVSAMMRRDPAARPSTQELIDQYVMLPATHPSHPSQRPEYGRYIQKYHGLVVDISTSTSGGDGASTNTSALDASRPTHANRTDDDDSITLATHEHASTPLRASPIAQSSPGKGSTHDSSSDGVDDPPPAPTAPASRGRPNTSPPTNVPTALGVVKGSPPSQLMSPKVSVPRKLQNTAAGKKGKPAHPSHLPHNSPLLDQEDHEEALRRIRGAKSKIDVSAIRQHMLQRRADALDASSRSNASMCSSDIQILCPVASRERSTSATKGTAALSSPRRASPSSSPASSHSKPALHADPFSSPEVQQRGCPPIPHRIPSCGQSLSATVQAYLEGSGDAVSLEDLDDVAMLLNQYKLRRYGVY